MKITYNLSFKINEDVSDASVFLSDLAKTPMGKALGAFYLKANNECTDVVSPIPMERCLSCLHSLLEKEIHIKVENRCGIPYLDKSGERRFFMVWVGAGDDKTYDCTLELGMISLSTGFAKNLPMYSLCYKGRILWICSSDSKDIALFGYNDKFLYSDNCVPTIDGWNNIVANNSPMLNDLICRISTVELATTLNSETFGEPISVVDRDYPHDSHDTEPVVHPPVKKPGLGNVIIEADDSPRKPSDTPTVPEKPVESIEPPAKAKLETVYPEGPASPVDVSKLYKAATFAIASLDMGSILEVQTFYSMKYNSETNREPWAHMNEKILMKLLTCAVMKHCDELVELMKTNAFSVTSSLNIDSMFNHRLLKLEGIPESVFVGEITTVGDEWLYLIEYSPIRCFGTTDGRT